MALLRALVCKAAGERRFLRYKSQRRSVHAIPTYILIMVKGRAVHGPAAESENPLLQHKDKNRNNKGCVSSGTRVVLTISRNAIVTKRRGDMA